MDSHSVHSPSFRISSLSPILIRMTGFFRSRHTVTGIFDVGLSFFRELTGPGRTASMRPLVKETGISLPVEMFFLYRSGRRTESAAPCSGPDRRLESRISNLVGQHPGWVQPGYCLRQHRQMERRSLRGSRTGARYFGFQ